MATAVDYLTTAYTNACQRLAELDTVAITDRAKMTYTAPNGQSFGWNEYRKVLLDEIKDIAMATTGQSSMIQQLSGPFTVETPGGNGFGWWNGFAG